MFSRQRIALLVALMTFVASVYMLTYSARIESTDTLFMFDATASLVRFGDMRLDMTAGERRYWDYEEPVPELPLLPVDAEPLQIVLAAPLYWLADNLPGVGRVHAVWLFNVGVSALAVGVFYLYTLQLGYPEAVAVVGALLLGLGTLVWAYSKTFFQEPLTLLLILLTAFWVERWRTSGFRSWRMLAAVVGTFALALLARRGAVVALPTLAIIAFPYTERLFRPRWVRWGFVVLVLVIATGLYVVTLPQDVHAVHRYLPNHEAISYGNKEAIAVVNQALQGYLFSIGGSVWGTSPVLLLAVPGMLLLAVQNRMRYVVGALTILLTYALVYAVISRREWFGGLSFPPRFLVPTLPILLLCALPTLDYLLKRRFSIGRLWAWLAALVVIGYAVWVQFNAVSYWAGTYTTLLPEEAGGLSEWRGGLHNVRYLRWVLLPQLWGVQPFDFAWVRTGTSVFPLLFGVVGLAAVVMLVGWFALPGRLTWLAAVLPLVFVVCVGFGLRLIYMDDLYLAFSDGLWEAERVIEHELRDADMLVIAQLGHERFFLNYGDAAPRIVSLPQHPGEQPSPDQAPLITSPNPADLLENPSPAFIRTVTLKRERLWVLADTAPYIPWSVRPLERYMALHYFPLRTIDTAQGDGLPVRLIEYVTAAYHDALTLTGAENASGLRYGEHMWLVGYNLPLGETYAPGDALPVSLLWLADAPPARDYVVAFHLAAATGGVVASGEDSQPYAGFAPTSSWVAEQPVWDNRALRLPADVPPGNYQLWVALYSFDAAGEIELLRVTSGESAENGTIGVLPTVITVVPS